MSTTQERPAESAGALYRRTDISPENFFQALGRVRRAARDEIERLIDWLDTTIDCDQDAAVDDGPCDDDSDAEPSLGSFDRMSNQIKAWAYRWGDTDAELDHADDEPLGSLDGKVDQTAWAAGNPSDAELDGAESGIADHDGLIEQVGSQDWHSSRGGMV